VSERAASQQTATRRRRRVVARELRLYYAPDAVGPPCKHPKLSAATPHKRCRSCRWTRRTGPSARACTLSTREPAGRTGTCRTEPRYSTLTETMLDTLTDYTAAVNHALASQGMPARSVDEVRLATATASSTSCASPCPSVRPRGLPASLRRLQDLLRSAQQRRDPPLRRDARDVSRLRGYGVRCALVSNKADFAVQALTREYFGGIFDYAMGNGQASRRSPHPTCAT